MPLKLFSDTISPTLISSNLSFADFIENSFQIPLFSNVPSCFLHQNSIMEYATSDKLYYILFSKRCLPLTKIRRKIHCFHTIFFHPNKI